jgi:hypothetical protein
LDAARTIALSEGFHFVHGEAVEIAWNGMFQARGGDGEFESLLRGIQLSKAVD